MLLHCLMMQDASRLQEVLYEADTKRNKNKAFIILVHPKHLNLRVSYHTKAQLIDTENMTLSSSDSTLQQQIGLAPASVGNNDNNLQKHRASQQNTAVRASDRDSLHSMGSLMDFDDEENHQENRPQSSQSHSQFNRDTGKKTQQKQSQPLSASGKSLLTSHSKPAPLSDKDIGTTAALVHATSNVLATSSNMMRHHRRRLLAGGQVAASILTPHNSASPSAADHQPPGWDGLVRKGTKLKSFLDDALQHVATGYSVTNNNNNSAQQQGANKRQRVEDAMETEGNSETTKNQHFLEREQAATSVAKDKTKEVLLLQQVCAV